MMTCISYAEFGRRVIPPELKLRLAFKEGLTHD